MTPAYARRKDANHDEIAEAFRRLGWQWIDTYQHAAYTEGFPDGLVAKDGFIALVEVKGKRGRLTKAERAFHEGFQGKVWVIRSIDDVLRVTGEE